MHWLRDEGLLRYSDIVTSGHFYGAMLSASGFAVLGKASPSTPQKTLGDRVKSAATEIATSAAKEGAKSVAKEAAKEAASVVGELIGSFAGAFTRSSGGGISV